MNRAAGPDYDIPCNVQPQICRLGNRFGRAWAIQCDLHIVLRDETFIARKLQLNVMFFHNAADNDTMISLAVCKAYQILDQGKAQLLCVSLGHAHRRPFFAWFNRDDRTRPPGPRIQQLHGPRQTRAQIHSMDEGLPGTRLGEAADLINTHRQSGNRPESRFEFPPRAIVAGCGVQFRLSILNRHADRGEKLGQSLHQAGTGLPDGGQPANLNHLFAAQFKLLRSACRLVHIRPMANQTLQDIHHSGHGPDNGPEQPLSLPQPGLESLTFCDVCEEHAHGNDPSVLGDWTDAGLTARGVVAVGREANHLPNRLSRAKYSLDRLTHRHAILRCQQIADATADYAFATRRQPGRRVIDVPNPTINVHHNHKIRRAFQKRIPRLIESCRSPTPRSQ